MVRHVAEWVDIPVRKGRSVLDERLLQVHADIGQVVANPERVHRCRIPECMPHLIIETIILVSVPITVGPPDGFVRPDMTMSPVTRTLRAFLYEARKFG